MYQEEIYHNRNGELVLVNKYNFFVYEVRIFCRYKGYYGLINDVHYSSNVVIPNIVSRFKRDAHSEICCSLLAAPISWLMDNDYILYVKPDKKIIVKSKSIKNVKPKTTIGKSRSWTPNGQTDST